MATVIVFGPTGNVGSITAQTAANHGAKKVVLAMRDPSKHIRGLDEKAGNFERVKADLAQPETVTAAIKSTGATRAFFYLNFASPDGMKSTIEAIKAGGVQFVVFLSSSSIQIPLTEVPAEDMIPYNHAQVELNLARVFGEGNHVAVRPGGFATNLLREKQGLASGKLELFGGSFRQDNITPEDMGAVAGAILVNGPKSKGESVVYIYGPAWQSTESSLQQVAKALGKPVAIEHVGPEQGLQNYLKAGIAPPVAKFLVSMLDGSGLDAEKDNPKLRAEGKENVRKYTGREPLGLEEWVAKNKDLWTS